MKNIRKLLDIKHPLGHRKILDVGDRMRFLQCEQGVCQHRGKANITDHFHIPKTQKGKKKTTKLADLIQRLSSQRQWLVFFFKLTLILVDIYVFCQTTCLT